jgi:hypothetical protein
MSAEQCQLRPVAEEGCCTLSRCDDCGRYQLQVGPVSVRVPATVVRELYRCLCVAIARDARSADADVDYEAAVVSLRARH